MFEHASVHLSDAVMYPDYDPRDDKKRAQAGFKVAGWSEQQVDELLELSIRRDEVAPNTSPGVNR